jgi:hypothetical protein
MFRPVLLLAAVGILWCDASLTPPPHLDRCAAVFCAGVNEEDCPGEYLPYHPPERCCSVCTVYKGAGISNKYIMRITYSSARFTVNASDILMLILFFPKHRQYRPQSQGVTTQKQTWHQ